MAGAQQAVNSGRQRLDRQAEAVLLQRWEPVVRRLARRYGPAADREDLEQVARLALLRAARRFDPARGCQFSTFAIPSTIAELAERLGVSEEDVVGALAVPEGLRAQDASLPPPRRRRRAAPTT